MNMRKPQQQLARAWGILAGDWRYPAEKPRRAGDLASVMEQASLPNTPFYVMMALATAIATLGLLANSAATIIGAMIVAPLMAPIMSFAFGLVVADLQLIRRSLVAIVSGVILVIAFAFASTELIGLSVVGSEILSRTAPTLLDLGVAIAAGGAGAFAYTRRNIMSSIAGVAIAVALVPPLAVVGVGLAFGRQGIVSGLSIAEMGDISGDHSVPIGAFSLFLTNLAGIVVCAGAVFVFSGYGSWKKAALGLLVAVVASAFLIQPLHQSLHKLWVKSKTLELIASLPDRRPELYPGKSRIDVVKVVYVDDLPHVTLKVTTPRSFVSQMERRVDLVQQYLAEALQQPLNLRVEMTLVDLLEFEAGPEAVQSGQAAMDP